MIKTLTNWLEERRIRAEYFWEYNGDEIIIFLTVVFIGYLIY